MIWYYAIQNPTEATMNYKGGTLVILTEATMYFSFGTIREYSSFIRTCSDLLRILLRRSSAAWPRYSCGSLVPRKTRKKPEGLRLKGFRVEIWYNSAARRTRF